MHLHHPHLARRLSPRRPEMTPSAGRVSAQIGERLAGRTRLLRLGEECRADTRIRGLRRRIFRSILYTNCDDWTHRARVSETPGTPGAFRAKSRCIRYLGNPMQTQPSLRSLRSGDRLEGPPSPTGTSSALTQQASNRCSPSRLATGVRCPCEEEYRDDLPAYNHAHTVSPMYTFAFLDEKTKTKSASSCRGARAPAPCPS